MPAGGLGHGKKMTISNYRFFHFDDQLKEWLYHVNTTCTVVKRIRVTDVTAAVPSVGEALIDENRPSTLRRTICKLKGTFYGNPL